MFFKDLWNFARDMHDLLGSGLFMPRAYAERYLKTKWLAWLALAHYSLIGEKKGYRPNPFFDPIYFKRESGTERLIDYLRIMHFWRYATSDFFDSHWYTERYSADLSTTENPLQHFWRKGFDEGRNPSERFDMGFFVRALARDRKDLKATAYEIACRPHDGLPLNIGELEALQQSFYDKITFTVQKRLAAPRKPFLVFVQAGHAYQPPYDPASAPFDLLVNYYDSGAAPEKAQYIFVQQGTKTTAIRKILDVCPEVFLAYEAVLFLDDDIGIAQDAIGALFAAQREHQLDLLQASLSEESQCYFPILKQPLAGPGIKPISGVEIMMPLVSKRALAECGWVFAESVSGWSVDLLLSAEVRKRFGNRIALDGDVIASHPRATDLANNALYKYLAAHGLDPRVEAGKIAIKFSLNDKMSAIDFRVPKA